MNTIKVNSYDGITVVHLARPPVNAVNREMQQELRSCFESIAGDRSTAAVVLAAEGDRAFCGGVDLHERSADRASGVGGEHELSVADLVDAGKGWRDTQHALRHCPVPVIVAVDGPAIGAGFGLVGCCDIIFASPKASFGLTEINVGLLGGSSKALRMVGPFKARSMFFTGELMPAGELYRLGVLEELVDEGSVEARAIEYAKKFADKSPIALRLAKESILRIEGMPLEDAYRLEQDYTQRLRSFNDSTEALKAFIEKRPPSWSWS